jgi:hypothetical protein
MALDKAAAAYRALGRGLEAARAELALGEQMISSNRERLLDLMAAGRSADDLARMARALDAAGFDVEPPGEIHHERGPLMGWVLRGRRRDG